MKNAIFWDVTPCGYCKNRRFRGTYRLHHELKRIVELGTSLAVTSNRSMMIEAIRSFETSVLTRATRPNVLEDVIIYNNFALKWDLDDAEIVCCRHALEGNSCLGTRNVLSDHG
jgi:hypothetical protein